MEKPLDFRDSSTKIAFAYQSYATKDFMDDPRFVNWHVRLYGGKNGEDFEQEIPYHFCTDKDYDEFYPIRNSQ